MNVTLDKTSEVAAVITIEMQAADYEKQVKQSINQYAKKAQMPGFRPGKVPVSLVKKMYGTQVKAEEVNKLLQQTLVDYIKEQKLAVLGEPMICKDQAQLDIETSDDFTFKFDIALAPTFKAELTAKDSLPYYDIKVSKKEIDDQVKSHAKQSGHHENVETYQDGDILRGALAEQDAEGKPMEGGILVDKASLMPQYFVSDAQKKIFEKAKVGDVITFNVSQAYEGRDAEIAALLKIEKDQVADHKGDFTFQVEEISHFVAAEVNQELFDRVFGEGNVKSEEEFRSRIKEQMQKMRQADSDYKFLLDLRKYAEDKVGELQFPEDLLKRFMQEQSKEKEEIKDEDFQKSLAELKWHLIKEQLVAANNINVSQEDVQQQARNATRYQFMQYGINNIPDEYLEQYAAKMLEDRNQTNALVERAIDEKLTAALKNVVKLDHKSISFDDFAKLFEAK